MTYLPSSSNIVLLGSVTPAPPYCSSVGGRRVKNAAVRRRDQC